MGDYGQNIPQAGDILHVDTPGGGDIVVHEYSYYEMSSGETYSSFEFEMTTGPESMIYDCLFGGNFDDDGSASTEKLQWCGNEDMPDKHRSRGRFQSRLQGRPLTSASVSELEAAAVDDILSQAPNGAIKNVTAQASITGKRSVHMVINVVQPSGSVYTTEFGGEKT